jgi:hypothetical protein
MKKASRICTVSWALRDASPEVPILDEAVAAGRMFDPNLVDRELVAPPAQSANHAAPHPPRRGPIVVEPHTVDLSVGARERVE